MHFPDIVKRLVKSTEEEKREPLKRRATPRMQDDRLVSLISNIKDYQIVHGSLLKNVNHEVEHTVQARPIGVSLYPQKFPRALYEQAVRLQATYNELYAKVASDEAWIEERLGDFLTRDAFGKILWNIHRKARLGSNKMPQDLSLGVFRSDYMVHDTGSQADDQLMLKQVEFNAFSCAGSVHANTVANMHRHLHRRGEYGGVFGDPRSEPAVLPRNDGKTGIVEGLVAAHNAYGAESATKRHTTGILLVVQPHNTNIADERPLEYALWDHNIPTYRLVWGSEILSHVSRGPDGDLLFSDVSCPFTPLEVSVVYLRAGYELEEYDEVGCAARTLFEQSKAIKVPSVLSHITTFKKVQQELAVRGTLERFLHEWQCRDLRDTFMPMYPLDESEQGQIGRKLASDPETAALHVLKPSLEGGGNNVYGADIPLFMARLPKSEWGNYILMEMIRSPVQEGMLMSFRGLYDGPVRSELGLVGTCLWRAGKTPQVLENRQVGWTFKSKADDVDEMSVVKGYGCFGTPWLVEAAEYLDR